MKGVFLQTGILSLMLLSCCMIACNNEDQPASLNGVAGEGKTESADFRKTDTALGFSGLWVNETYVNEIRKSKSPSGATIPENSCLIVPAKTLQHTALIYGFHEGEDAAVVKNGDRYELWDFALTKKLRDMELVDKNKLRMGKDVFVKLRSGDVSSEANPYNIVDLVLFTGKFRDGQGNIIEFSNSGKVTGIPGVTYYEAMLDYATSEAFFDQVSLGASAKSLKDYAFRFRQDTLDLFDLTCKKYGKDSICEEQGAGRLFMTMVREKE